MSHPPRRTATTKTFSPLRKAFFGLLIATTTSFLSPAQAQIGDRTVRFNHNPGTYWISLINSDFGSISGLNNAEKNRQTITGGNQLKVKLLANELVSAGGVTAHVPLLPAREYTLQYDVKFEQGFDWRSGGKLFGLGGGRAYTGCRKASAGDGWTFRVMWRRWYSVDNGRPYLEPYLYYKDMPGNCGHSFSKRYSITSNRWYRVRLHVKMNTGSSANGLVHMTVNGTTVLWNNQFRWVTQNSGREIDQMLWGIFRGGNDDRYKSNKDWHIYFDNITLDRR